MLGSFIQILILPPSEVPSATIVPHDDNVAADEHYAVWVTFDYHVLGVDAQGLEKEQGVLVEGLFGLGAGEQAVLREDFWDFERYVIRGGGSEVCTA